MNQLHYIQGKQVNPPRNYEDVYLQGNLDNDGLEISTSTKTFEWQNEEAELLYSLFNAGITGGQGIMSGIPHLIKLVENGTTVVIFDGYIDLQTASFDHDLIVADSSVELSLEWLDSIADSVTFEFLKEKGFLTIVDQVYVPYVLSSIPNYSDMLMISISSVFITTELSRQAILIAEALGETSTVVESIGGVLKLIAEILYTIVLLVAIFKLLLDLIDLIIQKIKYKPAMLVNRQIEAACKYLNIKYSSTVLTTGGYENMYIIPASKSNISAQSDERIKGFLKPDPTQQNGFFEGTLGDLLRELRSLFNLKVVMKNNTLSLEKVNTLNKNASFTLPNHYNPKFETNANELISNYNISFAYDTMEKNTVDRWTGNNVQVSLDYKTAPSTQHLRLLKGLKVVNTRFARAYNKTELSQPEKLVSGIYKVIRKPIGALVSLVNGVVDAINTALDLIENIIDKLGNIGINIEFSPDRPEKLDAPPTDDVIESRLGMLQLENDFFGVDKLVILSVNSDFSKTKISPSNLIILDAEYIYNNFHKTSSFAPNTEHAQRYIYSYENVELNLTEYKQIIDEGAVKLPTGEVCQIETYEYNASERLAKFVIRRKKLYTNNIKEVIYKPIGR